MLRLLRNESFIGTILFLLLLWGWRRIGWPDGLSDFTHDSIERFLRYFLKFNQRFSFVESSSRIEVSYYDLNCISWKENRFVC